MATLHEPPRKKIATYGKAARRRIAPVDQNYGSVFFNTSSKSQTPEADTKAPNNENTSVPDLAPKSPKHPTKRNETKATSTLDVFDVPDDIDDIPKVRKPVVRPVVGKAKSKATATVFDVPSSDEDKPQFATKMKKNTLKSSIPTSRVLNSPKPEPTKSLSNVPEAPKRQKLSPKIDPVKVAAMPNGSIVKPSRNALLPSKSALSVPPARPKISAQKKPQSYSEQIRPQKLPKLSPPIGTVQKHVSQLQNEAVSQLSDVDMMDVDIDGKYMTPKGLKLWKQLLDSEDESTSVPPTIEETGMSTEKRSPPLVIKTLSRPAGVSKASAKSAKNVPRKRLIDYLVEQSSENSEADSDDEMEGVESSPSSFRGSLSRGHSVAPEIVQPSASQNSQISGPKFVYGRERTILAEQDFMQALHIEMPVEAPQEPVGRRARRGSIPTLPALPSFHDVDLEDEEGTGTTIKNVHELRQAGVNNRFMDELDDFLERIGSPGSAQASMRRSGLLDLANKLKDKAFARQFRAHGAEERLFVHLGQETDIISGFILISILMTIFSDGNVPHIIPQLRRQGVTRLIIRLLEHQTGVLSIAKERKANMSKIALSLLSEYHEYLKQLAVWEDPKPQVVSPRTIALKCLEKMVRQTREAGNPGDIFSKELTSNLFEILKSASDESMWSAPQGPQAIDFFLALSALESHSITARTAHNEEIWISDFLPIIAGALQSALSQPEFGAIQLLILRLALNVTNNNQRGADVFARPALLAVMGQVVVARFKKITRFLKEDEFFIVLDHLVLTLGVMINFAEWSHPAREALQRLQGRSDDPLDRMAQLFLDNREKMAEADSVEDSQKNVAFGYLSVLLGYFALHPGIADRIRKRNGNRSLQPVVSSIEEFILHHKAVDEIIAADPDGHNAHSGLTERLESLVRNLSSLA